MGAINRGGSINRSQRAIIASIPAPVGGWNARDSLADMEPEDAVILDNFFPTPSDVGVRLGCDAASTGYPGNVTTVAPYNAGATSKLFGVSNGNIYDATAGGAIGAPLVTGLIGSNFQYANIGTPGGQFLVMVNGLDSMQVYNGQGWMTVGNGVGAAISALSAVGTLVTLTTATPHKLATNASVTVSGASPAPVAITTLTASGTTVTVTAPAHGLVTGATITMVGCVPVAYNGTYVITRTGANTFTYVAGSAPGVETTIGSYTCASAAYDGTFTITVTSATTFTYVAATAPGVNSEVGTYTYAPSVTGVLTSAFSNVCMHKQRLWFTVANTLQAYYLPTQSIGGAASLFDFSALFRQGGYLVTMAVWTLDAGYGLDDYLVIITSKGEIAVYQGTDPSTIATWSLIGIFQAGSPMSPRSTIKYGGDCLIINRDGLVPLSAALQSSRIEVAEAVSDKIAGAISQATTEYAGNFGWEVALFPTENMLLVNVPVSPLISYQYVMNTVTKAWCRFKGWTAYTFALFNDNLYYGGAGAIYQAWTGTSDNGSLIVSEGLQAFNYFGTANRGKLKRFNQVRPLLSWDNAPALNLGINTDFDQTAPIGVITPPSLPSTVWDGAQALWDGPMTTWQGDATIQKGWQTAFGMGYCAGLHLLAATNSQKLRWAGTDYSFEMGGVL